MILLNRVFSRIDKSIDEYCFVRGLAENEERHGLTKKESAWLAGLMLYVCVAVRVLFGHLHPVNSSAGAETVR